MWPRPSGKGPSRVGIPVRGPPIPTDPNATSATRSDVRRREMGGRRPGPRHLARSSHRHPLPARRSRRPPRRRRGECRSSMGPRCCPTRRADAPHHAHGRARPGPGSRSGRTRGGGVGRAGRSAERAWGCEATVGGPSARAGPARCRGAPSVSPAAITDDGPGGPRPGEAPGPIVLSRVMPGGLPRLPDVQGTTGGRPLSDVPEVYRSRLDPNRSALAQRRGEPGQRAGRRARPRLARPAPGHRRPLGRRDRQV